MQLSQLPTLLKLAFASLGGKNSIPVASQLPGNINGASYTDGFPPATRTAIVAGGKPPAGLDMNGVLFDVSSHIRWLNAGGPYAYDSGFATDSNVGGYPQGAQISSADLQGAWLSLNDNNTDNPDTGAGTKWVPTRAYGTTAITGLTNANVTLTPAQAAKNKITLAGTLTGNIQIIMPTWLKDWVVTNNTTGAFTATCKTSAGTGIAIPQNGSPTKIVGDGTNITQPAENIAVATQGQHAVPMAQAAGVVGSVRNLVMSVAAASATATLTADEIIVETALGGVRYCLPSFSKTINLATTGAGGMDAGSAPVSGWVAIYAIYNPTTQTAALLATNATSIAAPSIYAGGSMPSGYTASGLVSVVPTNGSSQFAVFQQRDREVFYFASVYSGSGNGSFTSLSIPSAVPKNAWRWKPNVGVTTSGASSPSTAFCPTSGGQGTPGYVNWAGYTQSAGTVGASLLDSLITAAQTTFYATSGTATFTFNSYGYTF